MIPTKKLTNGFEMPIFGLGTWEMGGRMEHNPANDDARDIRAIRNCIEQGITHIDTAKLYANGYTETLIRQALQGYDRSKIFLASKAHWDHLSYDEIIQGCHASLKRLGTEYLDLYLLHAYRSQFPLNESIKALDVLVSEGVVKNIGVCNFGKEHLAEAQTYAHNKIVCNQVHYNLIFREPEITGLLNYCQENDIILSAWRPVQKGMLLENVPPVMIEMCQKYHKTAAQIAINWLTSQPNVVTLSKMSSSNHITENLGSLDWRMSDEDIEYLRKEYPNQRSTSDAVPLG